jgi:hypothetical protein
MEQKKKPELLDALAFAALDGQTLINRLACLFLKAEEEIKGAMGRRARQNWAIQDKTVGEWMKSVYTPARGTTKAMVASVVTEALRQKELQKKRADAVAYRITIGQSGTREYRRSKVAALLFGYETKEWNEREYSHKNPNPRFLLSVGDHLVSLDSITYQGVFLYVRNNRTGRSTLTKMKGDRSYDTLPAFLFSFASKETKAALFCGARVTTDFDTLSFDVDGRIEPFPITGVQAVADAGKQVVIKL